MPVTAASQRGKGAFYQKVDQAFYDDVKRQNGGVLPPDLQDADGNPRKLTMSPEDRAYRQKWKAIAAKMRNSRAVAHKAVKSACVPCAAKKAAAKIPPILLPSKKMGQPISIGVPKPVTDQGVAAPQSIHSKPKQKATTLCKLVSASFTCSHGRQASDGILCVVPDAYGAIGDRITCKAIAEGGCGQHVEWSISGMWTSTEHGNTTQVLAKTFKVAMLEGWLGLEHIDPQEYQIQASACEGDEPVVEVRAYPPDKWGGKIDFQEIRKQIKKWLDHAPITDDEKESLETGWFLGAIEYSQQWKEARASNLAFCESTLAGKFDPLFGAKLPPVPIYPLNIVPAPLQKWLKAGVYFSLQGGFSIEVDLAWAYWPTLDHTAYEKTEVLLSGGISGKLSVNLFVVDENVIDAEVAGQTGLQAGLKFVGETPPAIEFAVQWTGLQALVTIKAAWGWIECSRTYPLVKESDIISHKWEFGTESGAGE